METLEETDEGEEADATDDEREVDRAAAAESLREAHALYRGVGGHVVDRVRERESLALAQHVNRIASAKKKPSAEEEESLSVENDGEEDDVEEDDLGEIRLPMEDTDRVIRALVKRRLDRDVPSRGIEAPSASTPEHVANVARYSTVRGRRGLDLSTSYCLTCNVYSRYSLPAVDKPFLFCTSVKLFSLLSRALL